MKIKLYVKKVPTYLDTTNFIQEYQDITKEFMKKVQKVQTTKDKLMIEKLISMHSCLNMDAYNKDLIQNDIEELSIKARNRIEQYYDWKLIINKYEDLFYHEKIS